MRNRKGCSKYKQEEQLYGKLDWNAYLGPVQPIVVPSPPLSFSTTSLSNSFLVSSGSASMQRFDQLLWDCNRTAWYMYIDNKSATIFPTDKKNWEVHNKWGISKIRTIGRGCQALVRNHYFIGRGLDLTPFHVFRFATIMCVTLQKL